MTYEKLRKLAEAAIKDREGTRWPIEGDHFETQSGSEFEYLCAASPDCIIGLIDAACAKPAAPIEQPCDVAEYPAGAIHNGRAFADQLESIYAFKEQEGHVLSLCSEWQSFVQCFEYLVQSVDDHIAHVTRLQAEVERLIAENARLQKEVARKTHVYQVERSKLTEERAKHDTLQSELTSANADKEAYGQNAIDLRRQLDSLKSMLHKANLSRHDLAHANTKLQSELTEARELLESIKTSHEHTRRYAVPTLEAWRARCMHTEMDVEEFLLAHQSAPAAKGEEL